MRVTKDYAATLTALNTALTFQHQADAVLSQANPVSATLYTVLATTTNARIISANVYTVWAVTQPTPMEIVATIDGITAIFNITNPSSATGYNAAINNAADDTQQMVGTEFGMYRAFLLEGRSVRVQVRVTWAITQPTPLVSRVKWAKR